MVSLFNRPNSVHHVASQTSNLRYLPLLLFVPMQLMGEVWWIHHVTSKGLTNTRPGLAWCHLGAPFCGYETGPQTWTPRPPAPSFKKKVKTASQGPTSVIQGNLPLYIGGLAFVSPELSNPPQPSSCPFRFYEMDPVLLVLLLSGAMPFRACAYAKDPSYQSPWVYLKIGQPLKCGGGLSKIPNGDNPSM